MEVRVCSKQFRTEDFRQTPGLVLAPLGTRTRSRPELKEGSVPLGSGSGSGGPSPCTKARAEESTPRKNYTKEAVARALGELEEGGSYRKVAVKYGIPHTTLRDYRRRRYAHDPHPNRALTPAEEEALVSYVLWMSERGFPVTGSAVRGLALAVVRSSRRSTRVNLDKGLSGMWWSRFRARHPEIAARAPGGPGPPSGPLDGLFSVCELLYRRHGFEEKPHLVFSRGEAALSGAGAEGRVSVHWCVSAAGASIPPFVVHPRPGDRELAVDWLDHFVMFAPADRPLLLFWDGDEARVSKAAVDACSARGVEVVCLPPRGPRPLDAAVSGPLGAALVAAATRNEGGQQRSPFQALLKEAYEEAVTAERVREGFRVAGLFPLSREAKDIYKAVGVDASPLSMLRPRYSSDQDPKLSASPVPTQSSSRENSSEVYYARPVVHAKDPDRIPSNPTESHILKVSSKDERSSGCSEMEEKSSPQEVKSLELYHGSSIFKSGEVPVDTRCLLELFRFCPACLVECSVSVEGQERLFSVTQACQSCGFHREWSNRRPDHEGE